MKPKKILIADDDPDIINILDLILRGEGYDTLMATDGQSAVDMTDETVDLIILDIMMPGLNGFHACDAMRKKTNAPILFLSAMSGDSEKSTAFLAGGDDYLCKPFSSSELIARVKSLLRRYYIYQGIDRGRQTGQTPPDLHKPAEALSSAEPSPVASSGTRPGAPFSIQMKSDNLVIRNGEKIRLTYIEYEILSLLLTHRGEIFSSQEIFSKIWAEPCSYNANNTVMVHILKLRKKLEADASHPQIIKTAWGRGYYIEKDMESTES